MDNVPVVVRPVMIGGPEPDPGPGPLPPVQQPAVAISIPVVTLPKVAVANVPIIVRPIVNRPVEPVPIPAPTDQTGITIPTVRLPKVAAANVPIIVRPIVNRPVEPVPVHNPADQPGITVPFTKLPTVPKDNVPVIMRPIATGGERPITRSGGHIDIGSTAGMGSNAAGPAVTSGSNGGRAGAGASAWMWAVPLALLALGSIWWIFQSSSTTKQIADLTERVRVEASSRGNAEAELAKFKSEASDSIAALTKARTDLEAANGKLDAEQAARQKLMSELNALQPSLDAETKRRFELEEKLAILQGKAPDADDKELAALRQELQDAMQKRESAEQALAALRTDSEKTVNGLRAGLDAETKRADAEAEARSRAEAALKTLQGANTKGGASVSELGACRDAFKAATTSGRIEFEFGSSTLTPASIPVLDRVADSIRKCPWAEVRVEGHTDARGTLERNKMFSENRARAVVDYLKKKPGIDAMRLTPIGYAHLNPVDTSGTPDADAKNRRIDFVMILN